MALFKKIRQRILELGELVKFSHTIFALPFALASLLIASGGPPEARLFFLIVAAMVCARTAGMSFNRYSDAPFDARNPRTASRQIPAGLLSKKFVLLFSIANAILFVLLTALINRPCLALSPAALLLVYGYSLTKRFTDWSHLVLGMVLGASPIAAWIAVTGRISFEPVLLGSAVLFWVAGFDIIYATQDYEFDRREGLHSLVVRYGIARSLWIARLFHLATLIFLTLFGKLLHFGFAYHLTMILILFLFIYEHSLVSPRDLSRVNAAFFNVNGFISLLFLAGVILSIL